MQGEEAFSALVSLRLMEKEFELFEKLTEKRDQQGYGEGLAEPGFIFHQALLSSLQTNQYLLHYELQAVGDVKLGYLNHKQMIRAIGKINEISVSEQIEEIQKLPVFRYTSKNNAKRMMKHSRVIELPKGWTYNSQNDAQNAFYLILSGELTFEI